MYHCPFYILVSNSLTNCIHIIHVYVKYTKEIIILCLSSSSCSSFFISKEDFTISYKQVYSAHKISTHFILNSRNLYLVFIFDYFKILRILFQIEELDYLAQKNSQEIGAVKSEKMNKKITYAYMRRHRF